jgi:hypothetical protein
MLKFVQTMQAFDEIENNDDDDNKSCDSFYQQIDEIEEEALDPLPFLHYVNGKLFGINSIEQLEHCTRTVTSNVIR